MRCRVYSLYKKDTSRSWSLFDSSCDSSFFSLSDRCSLSFSFVLPSISSFLLFEAFFLLVSSFRLYYKAKHLSLRCLDHFFILLRERPCATSICHRGSDDHVEKAKSVTQSISFGGQLLSIFVERCPRCLQSVFDLFCFLILERDFLSKISCTVSFSEDFNLNAVN